MQATHTLPRVEDPHTLPRVEDPVDPIRRAVSALDAARVRQPAVAERSGHGAWPSICALGGLVIAVAVLVLADVASGYVVMRPGGVEAAGDLAGSPGAGTLLSTSVTVRTASPAELVASWLGIDVGLRRPGRKPSTPEQFAASRRAAWVAAHLCVGVRPGPVPPESGARVTGASGGLMMALAHVEALRGRSLSSEHVAGTGVIAPDGSLHRVENVPLKVQAADASGASVFLVPRPLAAEAAGAASAVMRVVGVSTLDEALRALGQPGCEGGTT